ncbi:MAG: DUF3467 domain-containing protein [Phycisphaeraceae bacterium]
MTNNLDGKSIESISTTAPSGEVQQVQVEIDDEDVPVRYSSTVRVSGSAEEITLDFAGSVRPTSPQRAKLKIDQRVVLNPWAAKRLALALGQAIQRYEQTYGPLELDPRKRMQRPAASNQPAVPGSPPPNKLA